MQEGFALLLRGSDSREPGAGQAARAVLAAGEERLAEILAGEPEAEEGGGEDDGQPGPAGPEDVLRVLLGIAASAARAVALGRLCSLLGSCTLSWTSPRWSGELRTSAWKPGPGWPDGAPETVPPELRCRLAAVAAGEIRRVLREGGRVELEAEDGFSPDLRELRRIVCAGPP
jgi:hypothetical protein